MVAVSLPFSVVVATHLPLSSPLQLGSLCLLLVIDAQSLDAASRMHSLEKKENYVMHALGTSLLRIRGITVTYHGKIQNRQELHQ